MIPWRLSLLWSVIVRAARRVDTPRTDRAVRRRFVPTARPSRLVESCCATLSRLLDLGLQSKFYFVPLCAVSLSVAQRRVIDGLFSC